MTTTLTDRFITEENETAHNLKIKTAFGTITTKGLPEEELYTYELARIGTRECREILRKPQPNTKKFTELQKKLSTYKGLFIPLTEKQTPKNVGYRIKPRLH